MLNTFQKPKPENYTKEALKDYFDKLERDIKKKVVQFKKDTGYDITLTIGIASMSADCESFVKNKQRIADRVGIKTRIVNLEEYEPHEIVEVLTKDYRDGCLMGGVIAQLPLHPQYAKEIDKINMAYDADCLGDQAYLEFMKNPNDPNIALPCTAGGIIRHMKDSMGTAYWRGDLAYVAGRSKLVGDPLAKMLRDCLNMTVIQTHSKSIDCEKYMENASVICIAVPPEKKMLPHHIHSDNVTYDITIGRDETGLRGAIAECFKEDYCMTPVPGGVGPMTVYELMYNCIKLAEQQLPF